MTETVVVHDNAEYGSSNFFRSDSGASSIEVPFEISTLFVT